MDKWQDFAEKKLAAPTPVETPDPKQKRYCEPRYKSCKTAIRALGNT
jgi:hypothetical protein